ncbi:hypothetical protein [Pseudogemmobacter blasticus]|uniref:hypothetical protein n=1 Tax=Fuscovulum blasticum TaxID=1075 RepID=UPI0015E64992|nr:hypothetical protein [Fuscovulum blasticum]
MMWFASALFQRDTGGFATHVSKKAHQTGNGPEVSEFQKIAAGDKHLVIASVWGACPNDPNPVPGVVPPFGTFLADDLDAVALRKKPAQSVFCNHIWHFYHHRLVPVTS